MFLGLQDLDPLVRCTDPDPDPSNKIIRKIFIPTVLWLLFYFLSLKNDVNVALKVNKKNINFLLLSWRSLTKKQDLSIPKCHISATLVLILVYHSRRLTGVIIFFQDFGQFIEMKCKNSFVWNWYQSGLACPECRSWSLYLFMTEWKVLRRVLQCSLKNGITTDTVGSAEENNKNSTLETVYSKIYDIFFRHK